MMILVGLGRNCDHLGNLRMVHSMASLFSTAFCESSFQKGDGSDRRCKPELVLTASAELKDVSN